MPLLLLVSITFNQVCAQEHNSKQPLQLKEVKWLDNSSNKTVALTQRPPECLNPQAEKIALLGKIAFESPALLGGQAAKMALSCASCHPSGRTNSNFFLDSISDKPGTADVTHSFFSSTGGNNTLTPVTIPDLARREESKIQDRQSLIFRKKLKQLIEVEFDGQATSKEIIDGLQSYLANTHIQYCKDDSLQKIQLKSDWEQLILTVNALVTYQNKDTNRFIIRSARKQIESIYWRFKNLNDLNLENGLISLSRQLDSASLSNVDYIQQVETLNEWQDTATQLYNDLQKKEPESTYNPEVIHTLLNDKN